MQIQKDGSGNPYVEVGNVRITYVPRSQRQSAKDWAGSDVIRIQAYKDDPAVCKALFPGAEFPVESHKQVVELISAVAYLIGQEMP
ncbi:MAG: hypothetical protein ACP5VS_16290 [Desulfomonilaceae bacterium]